MKKFISYALLIVWMTIIFFFSNIKATESTKQSDSVIDKTIVQVVGSINKDMTIEQKESIIDIASTPIRKCAHLFLYFVLGLLICNIVKSADLGLKNTILISLFLCVAYACSDEVHQLFIEGRSGELKDVFIDSLGSILGIFCLKRR